MTYINVKKKNKTCIKGNLKQTKSEGHYMINSCVKGCRFRFVAVIVLMHCSILKRYKSKTDSPLQHR